MVADGCSSKTSDLRTGVQARQACRSGRITGSTAGLAPGYVQGNLAILPRDLAEALAATGALVAEAGHHQQRVVDGETEAEHRRGVQREQVQVHHSRQERQHEQRAFCKLFLKMLAFIFLIDIYYQ